MAVIDIPLPRSGFEEAEVADLFDLGVVAQVSADLFRILASAAHAEFERLEAAHQHPRGVAVDDPAHRVADRADLVEQRLGSGQPASDEIAVPAGIFGQAVDADVGALILRLGPQWPEEGIVDGDRRQRVAGESGGAGVAHRFDIDQGVGRVGGAFEVD